VLITKAPAEWRPLAAEIERVIDRVAPRLQVFISRVRPSRVKVPGEGWMGSEVLTGRRVMAFAALGRPDGFSDTLAEAGAEIVASRWFPDHHPYTDQELSEVVGEAEKASAIPVTTAKDAVKLPSDVGAWVVEVVIEPVEGSWNGLWRLLPEVRS
jgi:tetraacyldisaccharide 4'-kinase